MFRPGYLCSYNTECSWKKTRLYYLSLMNLYIIYFINFITDNIYTLLINLCLVNYFLLFSNKICAVISCIRTNLVGYVYSLYFKSIIHQLFMEKLLIFVYSLGILIRIYLGLSDSSTLIADRVEVSTPLNSWKRGLNIFFTQVIINLYYLIIFFLYYSLSIPKK